MNCTDLIVNGLVLIVGGVWVDAAGLPGAVVPVFGFHVFVIGLAMFGLGTWQAGRLVTAQRGTADP